jgi:glycosyltransferase involved in cell wall biosynthesis
MCLQVFGLNKNETLMLDFKIGLAFCIRKFLTKILTPLTGFIQRQELLEKTPSCSLATTIRNETVRWTSSRCGGLITFAYPEIPYHPIKARRQKNRQEWASLLLGVSPDEIKKNASEFLVERDSSRAPGGHQHHTDSIEPAPLSFTILICFHHHLDYFRDCLRSVEKAILSAPSTPLEVLIINDDPSIDLSPLLNDVQPFLRKKIVFRTHSENRGICSSLNEAVTHAQGEWLIYLDCDDLLASDVFLILEKKIRQNPSARFISSRAIDIDADGDILFWRLRSERPYELIENNFASHLKVVKKELHQDLGLFKKNFEGCQDYEFALRTAIEEPLLFISDYLYRYRWHDKSQTVSQNSRQNLTAMRIRQSYMLAIYWLTHGTKMLEWQLTGPEAASWKEVCSSSSQQNDHSYIVNLQATTPYNYRRWKMLLLEIAIIIIDRYREKSANYTIGDIVV